MKVVVFGVVMGSSSGNAHATLWRGLCKSLHALGTEVVFFERDVPYGAQRRDCADPVGATLVLYDDWPAVLPRVRRELRDADAAIVTSYCPDALSAQAETMDAARPLSVFYDLDSPITIAAARAGKPVPYVSARGLCDYDLVLSFAGGPTLHALQKMLRARNAHPLFSHVDPDLHGPAPSRDEYRADLCWLGNYAADRQRALKRLFVDAARARARARFTLAGSRYPADFPWCDNIRFVRHLPPAEHAAFLCSARLALNVTREPMLRAGWCPSGRLFETAACGAPIVSDDWPGLGEFYRPGSEILLAEDTCDVLAAMDFSDAELTRIGMAGRERTLASHTSMHRAQELVRLLEEAATAPGRPSRSLHEPGAGNRNAAQDEAGDASFVLREREMGRPGPPGKSIALSEVFSRRPGSVSPE